MSLVNDWVLALLRKYQLVKCFIYKVRNSATCKMNTAGSLMDFQVRNMPNAYNALECAVQIQRQPIIINKDVVTVDKVVNTQILLLKQVTESGQIPCACLYVNSNTQTQILIGIVKNQVSFVLDLLQEVQGAIYTDETQERLKPVRDIVQLFQKAPPTLEPEPEFFYHVNGIAPTLLFKKEDYGAFSPTFINSFKKRRSAEVENNEEEEEDHQKIPPTSQNTTEVPQAPEARKISIHIILSISQPFIEQRIMDIWNLYQKLNDKYIIKVSIPDLTENNLPVLKYRSYYLQNMLEAGLLTLIEDPEENKHMMSMLVEKQEIEEKFEIKIKTFYRQQYCELVDNKAVIYKNFDLSLFLRVVSDGKVIGQIEGGNITKMQNIIGELIEAITQPDPATGTPPKAPPATSDIEFRPEGVVFRGGLYEYVQIKYEAVQNMRFLVFAENGTVEQQLHCRKLLETAEKVPYMFSFCINKVTSTAEVASRRGLNNKQIVAPQKNIFYELRAELAEHGGVLVFGPAGLVLPTGEEPLEKAVEAKMMDYYQVLKEQQRPISKQTENAAPASAEVAPPDEGDEEEGKEAAEGEVVTAIA